VNAVATFPRPIRVQRKRSKGWRMPENTVSVGRETPFGNPFVVNPRVTPGSKSGVAYYAVPTVEDAVECFALMLKEKTPGMIELNERIKRELAGKNLACWCKQGAPCHADILLEIANAETV